MTRQCVPSTANEPAVPAATWVRKTSVAWGSVSPPPEQGGDAGRDGGDEGQSGQV